MFKYISKLLLISSLVIAQLASAQEYSAKQTEQLQNVEQKLAVARDRLKYDQNLLATTEQQQDQLIKRLGKTLITKAELVQARLDEAKAEANLQSIRISLVEANQAVNTISTTIKRLGESLQETTLAPRQDQPIQLQIQKLKDELAFQQKLYSLEQDRIRVLNKTLQVARDQERLQDSWLKSLKATRLWQEEQAVLSKLEQQKADLQASQHEWLIKLDSINKSITSLQEQSERETDKDNLLKLNKSLDEFRVQRVDAEEKSNLKQIALLLISAKQQLAMIAKSQETTSVYALRQTSSEIANILSDLNKIKKLHERKISLIELRQEIAQEQFAQQDENQNRQQQKLALYEQIKQDYQEQDKTTDSLIVIAQRYQEKYKQALSKALARRQVLPSFSTAAWENLGTKIAEMPSMAVNAMDSIKTQLTLSMKNLTSWGLGWLLFLQGVIFLIWLEGRTLLGKLAVKVKDKRTALGGETLYVLLELVRRNWLGLLLTIAIFSWFIFSEVPFKSYAILLWLILVWTAFKWGIGLARLTLLEGTVQTTGHDVILYRGLKWSMVLGGIVATLTVLAHQLPVTYEVSDFFNRILMVFFVGLGLFLLLRLRIVPILLAPHLEQSRPYVRHLIKVLSFLIPLAMLCNAVIGLLGYIQLAWTISKYEMVFVMVLIVYMLARGIMIDLMANLASFTIRHLRNGWLWTEAILKPLDRIIRVFLLFFSIWFIFNLYGWDENTLVISVISQFFKIQLFNVGESPITPLILIQLFIISMVIYWTARWSKEFAYRWLFARTKDVGMRNSMASLFQYSLVLISSYIGLQVLELDWTGLKFVLVAFAAGVGFGLRDTANNLVSGLLLLFERPVRRGDLVTVGSHEGEVVHIGMRSLVLHTWDHMDVLVPNSEIFSKSFINWTRQDPIIRSTFNIRVQRDDDPRRVRSIIEKILADSPDVLAEPEWQVYFTDVSEDLINIEVRYHINLQISGTRVKVRSDLLFSIWRTFKEAGIRAPYHQQDIHVRTLTGDGKPPFLKHYP